MKSLTGFSGEIERKLALEEEKKQAYQQQLSQRHEMRTDRLEIFSRTAEQIVNEIIRPRMERMVSYFDNASIPSPDCAASHCVARFETRPRYPASVTVEFSVSHDAEIEQVNVIYMLEILPIFFKYEKRDAISFSLADVDTSRCENWVEGKLLAFLDGYLQLEHIEQYQKQNLVTDPVCGMQVNKAFAIAEANLGSQKYYFCTQECHDKFVAEHSDTI